MKDKIERSLQEKEFNEEKIEGKVSINFDSYQFMVRIPKKVSNYFRIKKGQKLRFTVDIPYVEETGRKIAVVEVVDE